ncbi:MAG: ABC transporter ATP-binding protein [Chloroflexi bacterium]|nr:MAG: ABC transporter ATP-binding protein [Chloroflexota bacterium]
MAELAEKTEAVASREAAAGTPAVKTVELTKKFGRTVALAGLSMTVPRGEVFGFLGPNGAGKTTAVKLLLGLLKPTSGEGWLLGKRVGDLGARRRIGYLPELFRYQSWLTAREVLALHCELAPLPRAAWKDEIKTVLETVGLSDRAQDKVGTFSKGMQQRLGLGAALLGEPELVFLDLLSEVEQVCDRVAVVDHGRVIAEGTMDALLGGGTAVRVRVTGLAQADKNKLASFGRIDDEGEQLTFASLDPERVPELVTEIVAMGGRVYEVAPRHQTLEDRFLQLLEDEEK